MAWCLGGLDEGVGRELLLDAILILLPDTRRARVGEGEGVSKRTPMSPMPLQALHAATRDAAASLALPSPPLPPLLSVSPPHLPRACHCA
jgi:hypothetical protein